MATALTLFQQQLSDKLPASAFIEDYPRRYAFGTDASFYRLVPQLIVLVADQQQAQQVISAAATYKVAITFRAAGTSLSGQAITDSVLVLLSDCWSGYQIEDNGAAIRLEPAIIGARANAVLAPFGRKIGPDPASINSCKIAGMAANNSSGMCCGVAQNSYHTVKDMTLIFADGTVLDTRSEQSRSEFLHSHQPFINDITALAKQVTNNPELAQRIAHKYRLKNTTGYGLNALIDYTDPIEIIKHLMIGSEGTLGFIADITYHTVIDHAHKSSAFIIFDDISQVCELVKQLATLDVAAVELLDKRSLLCVAQHDIMPKDVHNYPADSAALLIEVRAEDATKLVNLQQQVDQLVAHFSAHQLAIMAFSTDAKRNASLWNIRKGTFPAVGAVRENGTTVIIEDVAFELDVLAQGVKALHQLFDKYSYDEAIIFGHALAGNLHFVFTQAFDTPAQVARYEQFMRDVSQLVAVELNGSLKAEHGTGRNMAPFVATEWGTDGFAVMQRIKQLFDKDHILNPGVIINTDENCHIQHLKTMPSSDDIIDKCIECGFCETVCPSKGLTLTPRQRITLWRRRTELVNQLSNTGDISEKQHINRQLSSIEKDFQYLGIDSCAATGLCGMKCPVGINTGEFIKSLRAKKQLNAKMAPRIASFAVKHFAVLANTARFGLTSMAMVRNIIGAQALRTLTKPTNKLIGTPLYYSAWPRGEQPINHSIVQAQQPDKVVYLPSCASRVFAADEQADDRRSIMQVMHSLATKAGVELLLPMQINELCCGMPFASKGLPEQAKSKAEQLLDIAQQVSENGRYPIIFDASPCALTSNEAAQQRGLTVLESAEFAYQYLLPKLTITAQPEPVMLHVTCSSKRRGSEQQLVAVAKACSNEVIIPADIECCGFAGDKGFNLPELNANALKTLRNQVPQNCSSGISNSRSCEIGLTQHSGINYQSVLYLLDKVSQAAS
ncbi:FAD-binding oxidoreductase [Pseudoalteromonas sp. SG41-5]|uniref:FAD-binding and (Fe-S)-binding domain-containing protein n=1 Tax=Pseudoalteromonas sp. SG41-5 TaxID=2760975 RepID=UPI0016024D93|nr:FAD-binding and (Fe-S)-binding domain-containing protein [Pseudoalteromonas sp. SG41-5]MBB1468481.1 FAD-binding oxidoreductase [Pseudoalteromonas sp. SG41-5]